MSTVIRAVYEQGVLRPLHDLNLPEKQQVRIQIWPEEPEAEEEILQLMIQAGLMRLRPVSPPPPPLSEEKRRALAEEIGRSPGRPVSEIVIEERGQR